LYFCAKLKWMKKALILPGFLLLAQYTYPQNEIGPEGGKLLVVFVASLLLALVIFLLVKAKSVWRDFVTLVFSGKRLKITIKKDRKYYPDLLQLEVKNKGNGDVDIARPLLIFDNFWFRRKFKLKGTNNYHFYPLILEKGDTHSLKIDLERFYKHDNRIKKYPKVKVVIYEREGRKLGSKSVFLRKTLVKF